MTAVGALVGLRARARRRRRSARAATPSRPSDLSRGLDAGALVEGVRAGDRRALARAITLVENGDPLAYELVRELYPDTGHAYAVGVTGPPGVGKSSLISALVRHVRAEDADGRRHLRRPVEPVHARRAARRPDPPRRPLPRSRASSSARWARAATSAASPRRRSRRRWSSTPPGKELVFLETVGAGQSEVGDHLDRGHGRARAHARLGRLDPGAEGRDHGDPRRDRRQQARPPGARRRW